MRRLPPLNALRAFESSARHLSFTRAAQELHVTQAAISHQVRALEQYLAVSLFRRLPRRVELTDEGQLLLPTVTENFDRLARAVEELKSAHSKVRTLTVSVTPSFGGRWLAVRLSRFWRQHPDIDLRLHHSNQAVDFIVDGVDMAVRWGSGNWPGLEAEFLMRSSLTPMCARRLLKRGPPLKKPEDLRHFTLLHEYNYQAWTQWLLAARAAGIDPRAGPVFDDPNVLDQAVLAGQGVALMRTSAVAALEKSHLLVRPFRIDVKMDFAYFIVYPRGALNQSKVRIFRDFLIAEASAEGRHP